MGVILLGYAALIEKYQLEVIPPFHQSYQSATSERQLTTNGMLSQKN